MESNDYRCTHNTGEGNDLTVSSCIINTLTIEYHACSIVILNLPLAEDIHTASK